MRWTLALLVAAAACAHERRAVKLVVPAPEREQVSIVAQVVEPLGDVQPIAIAVTNGESRAVRIDPAQAFAHATGAGRTASLPPGEAARQAGGRTLPGTVSEGAAGAARGGAMGAVGSAVNGVVLGAVSGGIGIATAAGAAVGGVLGAISGASGAEPAPDVQGFEDRALHAASLAPTFSATGYLYYPAGEYWSLEILLARDDGSVEAVNVPLTPAQD